jgi:tetratricopeptide (TPR) repeat protein
MWAEHYDGEVNDIFDLQDRVTLDVVGAITPKLESAEMERAKHKPTDSHGAYDCYLRGLALSYAGTDKRKDARQWFYRAIELDPDYAPAHAWTAILYARERGQGSTLNEEEVSEAIRLATRAAQLDSQDSLVLSLAGWALAFVARDLATAAGMIGRALALHPNLAMAWGMSGWLNTWLGKHDTAIEHFARSAGSHNPVQKHEGDVAEKEAVAAITLGALAPPPCDSGGCVCDRSANPTASRVGFGTWCEHGGPCRHLRSRARLGTGYCRKRRGKPLGDPARVGADARARRASGPREKAATCH